MPEKIGLIAVLEDKDFRKGLKNYIDGLDKMEEGNKDMSESAKKSGKELDNLGGSMKKGGRTALDLAAQMVVVSQAMNVVKELAGKGLELAKLGATAERVEERFGKFAEEAGGATEILAAFQEGAGHAASEMDAMLSSSKLLQMGLVDNADDMETVVEMATRLGDQTAGVTSRVEDFALMLANQSIPRLDNFGISSGQVRARIIELMGSVEGMTRETAFMQATMEAGGESLAILGERTKDTAMTFEIMEARMTDARVELGKQFAPIAGEVFNILGGLGDEVLMVGAAFGEFGGALVQAGPLLNAMMPALGKLPGALKAMNLGLNKSTLLLGGMVALIPILIMGVVELNKIFREYKQKMEEARAAASLWREEIEKEIDSGATLHQVIQSRLALIKDEIDAEERRLTFLRERIGLSDTLVSDLNELTEANSVVKIAVDELTESFVINTGGFESANVAVRDWNEGIEGSVGLIPEFTEETYRMAQEALDAGFAFDSFTVGVRAVTDAIIAGDMVALGFNEQIVEIGLGAEGSESRFRHLTQAMQDGTIVTDEAEAAQARLVYELERQKQASENAAQAEEEQARKLEDLARAQDEARTAAFSHANELLTLAERLSDLDKGAVARAAIEELGRLQEEGILSIPEYTKRVEELQDMYGLVTAQGRFMTAALETISAAMATGELDEIRYAEAIETARKMAVNKQLAIEDLERALDIYKQPLEEVTTQTSELKEQMERSKKPIDELTTSTDGLTTAAASSVPPLGDAETAVDDFAEATLNAQDPVDELLARFELLPQQILDLAPKMRQAGVSLVGAFRVGFEGAFDALEAEKVRRLKIFREEFHASREPKDPTSPLRGFYAAGAALVQTYMEGLESKWPELGKTLDDLFTIGRSFGGLGGVAGGIINKNIRGMKDATKDIDAELQIIFKRVGGEGRPKGAQETYDAIIAKLGGPTEGIMRLIRLKHRRDTGLELTREEEFDLRQYEYLIPLMKERRALTEEQVRLQEKLARMEEAQTRLRFLEQQVALLKMIEEHGLDAGDILDGLQLGAEASAEAVLEAMIRAMDEVVRQAEERLGITSPSKVFYKIGQQTMAGMAMGIQDLATLPVRQSVIASRAVASAPAMSGGGYVDNSRSVTIQAGGNNITDAAEGAHFEARVLRAVKQGLVGQ